jgi:hypothetical protein
VECDGISRVCPVVQSVTSSSESESESEEAAGADVSRGVGGGEGAGWDEEGMVEGHTVVSSFEEGGRDHPVVLHSMHTFDESILHG